MRSVIYKWNSALKLNSYVQLDGQRYTSIAWLVLNIVPTVRSRTWHSTGLDYRTFKGRSENSSSFSLHSTIRPPTYNIVRCDNRRLHAILPSYSVCQTKGGCSKALALALSKTNLSISGNSSTVTLFMRMYQNLTVRLN